MNYFTFDIFNKTGLALALFTPKGAGSFGLNDPDSFASYEALGSETGITPERMVRIDQKHTSKIRIITDEHAGEGVVRPVTEECVDGMITDVPGLMLCTVEADCTPVYLLDPVNKAIGMVHSGWRGTAAGIASNAIRLMAESYGTDPSDIIAGIGPCICGDCYEVSDDLIEPFESYFGAETAGSFFTPKPNGKYMLDLKAALRHTLVNAGVRNENIEDSGYCTFHDNIFNSWRRDKEPGGRMLTAIVLR